MEVSKRCFEHRKGSGLGLQVLGKFWGESTPMFGVNFLIGANGKYITLVIALKYAKKDVKT